MIDITNNSEIDEKALTAKVDRLVRKFEHEKGALSFKSPADPMAGLVNTLLSHNTTDKNRDRAYASLIEKYPTWEEVHKAPVEELAGIIRVAGLNRQKAERLKGLLGYLKDTQGAYSVDFLREMNFDQAVDALGHLKGIGFKTLAVVMCFNLGVDVFPVDTHVHRLSKRLGLVPEKYDAVKTFKALRPRIPAEKSYQFHLHLIQYGREICHARKPECGKCFVKDECPYYLKHIALNTSGV
ncbi:MAG: endonuclease III [Candidatus Electryonea clarkiae]|nr:endonuclease III [Candidatus Electryonea clarkiae]MDP8288431.1 endonuclease III [Candidatus Electryonea clarkiae]